MTTVMSGGFGAPSPGQPSNGTEFISVLAPPGDGLKGYDNTKLCEDQHVPIPQIFRDAMSVREKVFGNQGVPLEAEFDEDDARSWHWVVYASVATTSMSSSSNASSPAAPTNDPLNDLRRRSSATATRLPVGTIRLIPPPHGPNKYLPDEGHDPHPDADPSDGLYDEVVSTHPDEPYIKFGRLAVLPDYRGMGLAKLLMNTALEYASKHPDVIRPPPSPTSLEIANQLGHKDGSCQVWGGLAMVHSQVEVAGLWKKMGFSEELKDENGKVQIAKERHWMEEGIEHCALWKRLRL